MCLDSQSPTVLAVSDATGGGGRTRRLANLGQSPRLIVIDAGRDPGLPGMDIVEAVYEVTASM